MPDQPAPEELRTASLPLALLIVVSIGSFIDVATYAGAIPCDWFVITSRLLKRNETGYPCIPESGAVDDQLHLVGDTVKNGLMVERASPTEQAIRQSFYRPNHNT